MGVRQTLNIMVARIPTGGRSTAFRGRFPARYVGYPFLIGTTLACVIAIHAETQRTGTAPWTVVGTYVCLWFFAQMYGLAWRVGAVLLRFAGLGATLGLVALLSWYHVDQSAARVDYGPPLGMAQASRIPAPGELRVTHHPPAPLLVVAAALDVIAGALLFAHGVYLGWGERPKFKGAFEFERMVNEMQALDQEFERELREAQREARTAARRSTAALRRVSGLDEDGGGDGPSDPG